MTWYTAGAAVIVFMLVVNLGVFLLRARLTGQKASTINRTLPADELGVWLAMVAVWVAGFASPYLWPDTRWGQAMGQTWALPCLVAWSMLVAIVLLTAKRLERKRVRR